MTSRFIRPFSVTLIQAILKDIAGVLGCEMLFRFCVTVTIWHKKSSNTEILIFSECPIIHKINESISVAVG